MGMMRECYFFDCFGGVICRLVLVGFLVEVGIAVGVRKRFNGWWLADRVRLLRNREAIEYSRRTSRVSRVSVWATDSAHTIPQPATRHAKHDGRNLGISVAMIRFETTFLPLLHRS